MSLNQISQNVTKDIELFSGFTRGTVSDKKIKITKKARQTVIIIQKTIVWQNTITWHRIGNTLISID